MKRKMITTVMVALLALTFALPVAAMGNGNVKGEITAVAADSITILSNKGEVIAVSVPLDYDTSALLVGDSVLVRGTLTGEGTMDASTIKVVGGDDAEELEEAEAEETDEEGDGSLANSAFCAEDKQEKSHPLAVSIAESYGVGEEEVIGYFCEGHSFGAIILALVTSDIQGGDYAEVLASRAGGQGWGQIWKELKFVGSENGGASPPGLFHRPENAGNGKPENPGNPND